MAYQARHRDPLFDSDTQAIIERRGKELLGMVLLGLSLLMMLMLGSYSPDDPNWLSATDTPAKNLLGPLGAAVASPLYVIAGYGAWAIALVMGGWGLRFVLHYGEERALGRLIFAPIGIALVSVFASTHVPSADWSHSFGLGGLFGDTVLGAVLGVLPVAPGFGLKFLSFALAAGAVAMGAFVLGFTRDEVWAYVRYLAGGLILIYDSLLSLMGRGAARGWHMAVDARSRAVARREEEARFQTEEPDVVSDAVLQATSAYRDDLDAGAAEVHFRIASPPTRWSCFYGVDTPERSKLLAAQMTEDEMCKYLGADSLKFITLDGLYRACGHPAGRDGSAPQYCDACFSGDYPVDPSDARTDGRVAEAIRA